MFLDFESSLSSTDGTSGGYPPCHPNPLPKEIRGQGRDPILELEVILILGSGSGV